MPLMLIGLLIGLVAGTIGMAWFWWSARREVNRLDEQKQMLLQENQIVIEFMHNLVEAIGEGVTREELFQRVVHAAILSTGALSACIFELKGTTLRGVAVEGLFPPHRPLPEHAKVRMTTRARFIEQVLRSEVFEVGEGLVGAVAKTGQGLLIANAVDDPRIIRHDDPALRVRSVIVVPILFREKLLGVLAIVNPSDGNPFNQTDFSLASSLAEQAGLAIHNLTLMELQIEKNKLDVDLSLASNIQGMLLPRRYPKLEGLDIGAHYEPAQKVGGDLYDVFALDEDRLAVAIADVSGKGIPASLLMAICQSNLRHFARSLQSPAAVLSALNAVLTEELRKDMFITCIYGVINRRNSTLTYARAGHEKPAIYHWNPTIGVHQVDLPTSEGIALGMVANRLFAKVIQEVTLPFNSGDIFLLYTDGITETTNQEGMEFSNSRLADTLKALHGLSAAAINEGLLEKLERFAEGGNKPDDLTLLTVKRT